MKNTTFHEQSLKAEELSREYRNRLDGCPVPFDRVHDSVFIKAEDTEAFHVYMSKGDK